LTLYLVFQLLKKLYTGRNHKRKRKKMIGSLKYFIDRDINDSVFKTDESISSDQLQRIQKVILNGFSRWVKIRLDC
tara:strand:- start:204 stop:431 length:228 start_codon:yes stop_codon:yes gene_type:complete